MKWFAVILLRAPSLAEGEVVGEGVTSNAGTRLLLLVRLSTATTAEPSPLDVPPHETLTTSEG